MSDPDEHVIEAETEIKSNPQSEGYWWERYFGACACLSDETWLHDANSTVDASKIKVEEDGHVLATVDDSGVAYGDDEEEEEEAVPPPVPPVKSLEEAKQEPTPQKEEKSQPITAPVPTQAKSSPDPAPASSAPAAATSQPATTKPTATPAAAPATKAVPAPAAKAKNDEAQEMKVDLGEVKKLLKGDGIAFLKHCRDGKIRQRTLVLSQDEKKFGWKSKDPKKFIDLAAVTEVRPATALDPTTLNDPRRPQGMGGTATLRKSSEGPAVGRRAFSFILKDRTIDVECYSEVECKKLCAAFKVMVDKAGGGKGMPK
uniref:PH domain-containing protein n=1 Tax=Aureoumbra lagunensis TaxID=44058 RepID=A0A7S3JQA3_9STRA|mmetsp:Transcript_3281/g.4548  ORF Transcript_3281/g.4548 Transcript_3281/m.4548 type:complete len:315 (-) Transcript_3281:335-1279(-)|eukprot:CAMPEP_0197290594 /NCGR_PEP_ID=MMETSP0890-20130614/8243_1 /TAXON_ID=44058 ORGANISM="Aureoumbra lagunensis, Strain CCMP1510" /NCGR_SAMPLE_ID=MMETSP0890 /ASSEMBLY_ACC=CAM_ASM_000533 /LENGTH=314 /DNA_ID=CAMNT_0042762673 /DNA_START=29 /DNA_END=976 /DNA_ORIENTATION=+